MTTNEIVCFTDLSYKVGVFAPGLKIERRDVNQVRHHGVLAHGLAVQGLRASARAETEVGLAENAAVFVPVVETPAHIEGAHKATRECAVLHRDHGRPLHGRRQVRFSRHLPQRGV
jgi:beta-glucosidase